MTDAPNRRGRPRRSRATGISRETIAERALQVAGDEGFPAVTMHRLAAEFAVTPRALYHHVRDRQEVVDLAAARFLAEVPDAELDPQDWEQSVRQLYAQARDIYRRYPRALLISLDESLTPTAIDVRRIDLAERLLAFGAAIGLEPRDARAVQATFLTDVFGFALLVDHLHDRASESVRDQLGRPVPGPWLDAHPDHPAPHARKALDGPAETSDDLFDAMVELRVVALRALMGHPAAQ